VYTNKATKTMNTHIHMQTNEFTLLFESAHKMRERTDSSDSDHNVVGG